MKNNQPKHQRRTHLTPEMFNIHEEIKNKVGSSDSFIVDLAISTYLPEQAPNDIPTEFMFTKNHKHYWNDSKQIVYLISHENYVKLESFELKFKVKKRTATLYCLKKLYDNRDKFFGI